MLLITLFTSNFKYLIMPKYLYGAVVHGIQSFIFDTGKLKEIIGASEYIEQLCTSTFQEAVGESYVEDNHIIGAAGKIQYLFNDKYSCQELIYDFSKSIQEEVPGLTFSQAVVEVKGDLEDAHISLLEKRLAMQRSKAKVPHGLGWMITERARRTGGNAIHSKNIKDDIIDRAQQTKEVTARKTTLLGKLIGDDESVSEKNAPKLFENLLKSKETGWIAVVHADGNNLGKIIQEIKDFLAKKNNIHLHEVLKKFSANLDLATRKAAAQAYQRVVKPVFELEKAGNSNAFLPIRPVLLGGDDITLVIRGELALDFTAEFLTAFSYQTKQAFQPLIKDYGLHMLESGLTACAGISYIKFNFPFHYGVNLSESLCKYSKTHSKAINANNPPDNPPDNPPASLSFHRVQSSFVEEYGTIIKRELQAGDIFMNYGPYFIEPQPGFSYATIKTLQNWVRQLNRKDAPKASIRTWLKELKISPKSSIQMMERIKRINSRYIDRLQLDNPKPSARASKDGVVTEKNTHLFDVISLVSIKTTNT